MRPSELITARAEVDQASRALARAAAAHLVLPTRGNAEALESALRAYTEARRALDA